MSDPRPAKGILLMLASNVAFCGMSILIRSHTEIDSFMVAMSRFCIGLGLLGTVAMFGKIKLRFVNGPMLFFRGLTGGIAVFLFYLSIARLGIGKGTIISYSYPIFAAIFGGIFLKERIGVYKAFLIITAFAGMVLMTLEGGKASLSILHFGKYEMLALLGALLGGIAVILVKRLHATDSTYSIFFAQCAIGLWFVVVPANMASFSIGYTGGIVLVCIGVAAAAGQLLMTEGYRYTTVSTGSLLGMLAPILNLIVAVLLFREPFGVHGLIGAVMVIASCLLVIAREGSAPTSSEPGNTVPAGSAQTNDGYLERSAG